MHTRTYLQDGNTSPYPFMEHGDTPPFPYSCVYAVGVCARPYFGAGTYIVATAAQLSAGAVSLTLAWKSSANGDVRQLCTLTADHGKYGHASNPGEFSAWMCAGTVPERAFGSYAGCWRLDPSCVSFVSSTLSSRSRHMWTGPSGGFINSDRVSLSAAGFLILDVLPEGVGGGGNNWPAGGRVAILRTAINDTDNTVQSRSVAGETYSTVQSVNGIQVPSPRSELRIRAVDPDGVPGSDASRSCITFDIDRIGASSVFEQDINDNTTLDGAERNGEAVIITVNGHKNLPNCYARDEDEALD